MTQYLNHDHPEGIACKYKNFEILVHIAMSSILNFPSFSGNCLDFEKSKRYAQLPIEVNNPASVTKFASAVLEP